MKKSQFLTVGILIFSLILFPELLNADKIILKTGEELHGRILEVGTDIQFTTAAGTKMYKREDIEKLEWLRTDLEKKKPNLPDLDVTLIERLPRYPSLHGRVKYEPHGANPHLDFDPTGLKLEPETRDRIRFVGHVKNVGLKPTGPYTVIWFIDKKEVKKIRNNPSLNPDQEAIYKLTYYWRKGRHIISLKVDPETDIEEISTRNNQLTDPIWGFRLGFVVDSVTYKEFNNSLNLVGTFSFEDWAQYEIETMNLLFKKPKCPSTWRGIRDRVRIDNIAVIDTVAHPEKRDAFFKDETGKFDIYQGSWTFGRVQSHEDAQRWAEKIDWDLIRQLGRQLGLVDLEWLDR